ncbi:hypothetical protein A9Q96_12065 [Rhodobacterales bacterium 52_120_T64]|nr:hypothetical protein A9Q96_12065 [Rhodobacterales bacterium 52_120_T64]
MFNFRCVFSVDANSASSKKQIDLGDRLDDFVEDESGIATVWSMFWLILCFSISGLAIDVTNAWKVHTILQSTADSSALAGAYELQSRDTSNQNLSNIDINVAVKDWAVDFAEQNMNVGRYGDALLRQDVQLGYWIAETFVPMAVSPTNAVDYNAAPQADAVRVITRQSGTGATSAVGTFFLRFVGFDRFTVSTSATVKIFIQQCQYDGLIATGQVKLSTGQEFLNKFCVHGEDGIYAAQNNYFDEGTIASAPTVDGCGQNVGKCTDSQNLGFNDAFRVQSLFSGYEYPNGDVVLSGKPAKIDDYIASFSGENANGDYNPFYVDTATDPIKITLRGDDVLDLGRIIPVGGASYTDADGNIYEAAGGRYIIECKTGKPVKLAFPDEYVGEKILERVVVVGDGCDFIFDSSVKYEDVMLATNSTGQHTFSGATGVVLGRVEDVDDENDRCDTKLIDDYEAEIASGTQNVPPPLTGSVTLISLGSVNFASKLSAYGLEIIAAENVHLASEAQEASTHIGTSVSAGGDIGVTHDHVFWGCVGQTVSVFDPIMAWALVR